VTPDATLTTQQTVIQLTTKDFADFVVSNPNEAFRVRSDTKMVQLQGELDCKTLASNNNPWFEKRINSWSYANIGGIPGVLPGLVIPWQFPIWTGAALLPDKGGATYTSPGTSTANPWWAPATNSFTIQKQGVYWFKASLVLDFNLWGLNDLECEVKLRMLPTGKTHDATDGVTLGHNLVYRNRIQKQILLPVEEIVNLTECCQVYVTMCVSPFNVLSLPIPLKKYSYFRMHLLD
jgi:hypothetical protein